MLRLAPGLGVYALVKEARTPRASQRLLGGQSLGATPHSTEALPVRPSLAALRGCPSS